MKFYLSQVNRSVPSSPKALKLETYCLVANHLFGANYTIEDVEGLHSYWQSYWSDGSLSPASYNRASINVPSKWDILEKLGVYPGRALCIGSAASYIDVLKADALWVDFGVGETNKLFPIFNVIAAWGEYNNLALPDGYHNHNVTAEFMLGLGFNRLNWY